MRRVWILVIIVLWMPLLGLFILWSDAPAKATTTTALILVGLLPLALALGYGARHAGRGGLWPAAAALAILALTDGILWLGGPRNLWFEVDNSQSLAQNLGPFVPTPQPVVDKMLAMAGVTNEDVVYDLGCGDGRIVVTAAQRYGARGVGVEIDPEVAKLARAKVREEKVDELVDIRVGDALKVDDLEKATVVALYVLPEAMLELRQQLKSRLKKGTRVVSYNFDFGDWEPERMTVLYAANDPRLQGRNLVMLWVIP